MNTPTVLADDGAATVARASASDTTRPAAVAFRAQRAALVFLTYVAVQFLAGVLAGFLLVIVSSARDPAHAPARAALVVVAVAVGMLVAGVAAFALTRSLLAADPAGPSLAPFGCVPASPRSRLLAGLAGVALGALYIFVLVPAFPPPRGHVVGPLARNVLAGTWAAYWYAALAVLVAPVVEEFVFRSVLWTGFRRSWGPIAAGAGVTLLFLALHASEIRGYVPALFMVTTVGIGTVITRARSGSLVAPMVMHAGYNGIIAIVVLGQAG